ncbi:MAG: hypothetical protein JO182_05095 [Acidobacteriaceae bacterium]|nr:hypothetical protein [Acidobacteriaceae bacterium]MBV9675132.1 hypothetical protein [Acidobacteriaceae bacterium]
MSAPQTISLKRLAANRANAQFSTGPTTPEGKAKASLNAVKTGLTGRTVLLPSDDVAAYEAHIERCRREFQPVGDPETHLVQNLADTQWRLDRIPNLETGLFALGRQRYADLFADETDEHIRTMLLDAHILMTDAKHFKNLHLHESRLRRQYQQDLKELKQLQAQRKEIEAQKAKAKTIAPIPVNGFEFTTTVTHPKEAEKEADHNKGNGSVLVCTGSV